ncbi:MAG: HAD family phosphatase [Myxococcales bacterium]|nr:HAD family phosphatase [Myxococcales bacterium]
MAIEAILFDYNGVLIDDEPLHDEVWREVLEPLGITYNNEEYYGPLLGVPDYEFLRLVLERRDRTLTDEAKAALHEKKRVLFDRLVRTRPTGIPGVAEFVRDLAAHAPLGIVSGALRPEIDLQLSRLGIADCFRTIVAAGEYPKPKPDPAPYLIGREKLAAAVGRSFAPGSVIAVEDSTNGMNSGLSAGLGVLGLTLRIDRERLAGCFAHVPDFTGVTYDQLVAWRARSAR